MFQAKVGRVGEFAQSLAESLHRAAGAAGGPGGWRVLTDLSGPFDTVVLEVEADSLAGWEQRRRELFAQPEFQADVANRAEILVSGRNELYTIEARG